MDNTATEKYTKEIEKYAKEMLENLFGVIFPKDKSEKSAQLMIDTIDAAVGIAEFKDDDENITWGVLIDKRKIKDSLKLTEERKQK